ncbi:apolipoprotein N-acyltransferase [Naasia lichenicola]|uniref:Apolipoprotein N-acyltransferase n=2 Tax=Naasia lichenicola TaxID=2565933 RepID=A0A4S4FTG1_9MICO|nr:apolipoprotein N-acyltransferase [Naasia lichenicola]
MPVDRDPRATTQARRGRPVRDRAAAPAPIPLWGAVLVALLAGPVMDGAFPDLGVWPLAFVGIALVLIVLRGRRAGGSFLVGLVFGLSFYLVHIQWATLFLGIVPWLALSTLEALFVGVGSILITLAYRWIPQLWPDRAAPGDGRRSRLLVGSVGIARLGLLPLAVAGLWTAREAISAVWPYGGFSWGRVAMSQSESPFAGLFAWLGISGVSFAMVWLVAFAIELILAAVIASRGAHGLVGARRAGPALAVLLALGVATAGLLAVPHWQTATDGTLKVAAIQGNTKSGYFDQRSYQGEILDGHITATLPVLGDDVDVIVWPEGAADLDPLEDAGAAQAIDLVSQAAGAPIILGTITQRENAIYNSSLLWQPALGATDIYDKRHPVPFGEYVPDRAFWEPFAPDLIGLIGREYTPGTNDPVFDLGSVDGRDVQVAVNICFDIVDDALMRQSVTDGGEAIFAQSNSADFGRTDESVQQLAIARIRALETGRTVVNASTVGTTAIVAADGSTVDRMPTFTTGALVDEIDLHTGETPAVVVGAQLEQLVSFFGLAALLLAGLLRPRRRPVA